MMYVWWAVYILTVPEDCLITIPPLIAPYNPARLFVVSMLISLWRCSDVHWWRQLSFAWNWHIAVPPDVSSGRMNCKHWRFTEATSWFTTGNILIKAMLPALRTGEPSCWLRTWWREIQIHIDIVVWSGWLRRRWCVCEAYGSWDVINILSYSCHLSTI